MAAWVYVTIAAAFAQNLRFMLQKHLRAVALSTTGATFARFAFSAPLVWGLVLIYARLTGQGVPPVPPVPGGFWAYALGGGLAQILATMCVLALFGRRNFAVGITFKKTEVLQTALIGLIVLGEGVSPLALVAIAIGFVGVVLLSRPPEAAPGGWRACSTGRPVWGCCRGCCSGFRRLAIGGRRCRCLRGCDPARGADAGHRYDLSDADHGGLDGVARAWRDRPCSAQLAGGRSGRADQHDRQFLLVRGLYPAKCRLCEGAGAGGADFQLSDRGGGVQGKDEQAGDRGNGADRTERCRAGAGGGRLEAGLVRAAGLEPAWHICPEILSLLCLPFHHARVLAVTIPALPGLYSGNPANPVMVFA